MGSQIRELFNAMPSTEDGTMGHNESWKDICAQWRLRSTCSSVLYAQNPRCLHEEAFGPCPLTERPSKSDNNARMRKLILSLGCAYISFWISCISDRCKVDKKAMIRNRYNRIPHPALGTTPVKSPNIQTDLMFLQLARFSRKLKEFYFLNSLGTAFFARTRPSCFMLSPKMQFRSNYA